MRIGGSGAQGVNALQSDASQFRNRDYVVSQAGAFMGAGEKAATAAQFAFVQLFNPVGSGVTVLVDRIWAASDTTGALRLYRLNTSIGALSDQWENLLIGGAQGQAEIYTHNSAVPGGTQIGVGLVLGSTVWPIILPFSLQLGESESIFVTHSVVNTTMEATFLGREV